MAKTENVKKLTKKQRFLKAVEIPISGVKLYISDDVRAEIEGCRSILTYDENEIKLSAGKLKIGFVGSDLQITQYDDRLTVIEGFINSVNYERG